MATNLKAVTTCMGYQQITNVSASTALIVPVRTPEGMATRPTFALIIAEGQAVRWRDDGVAPTSSVGMPLATGVALQYDGDLSRIRFIEQTPGATLNITYYV